MREIKYRILGFIARLRAKTGEWLHLKPKQKPPETFTDALDDTPHNAWTHGDSSLTNDCLTSAGSGVYRLTGGSPGWTPLTFGSSTISTSGTHWASLSWEYPKTTNLGDCKLEQIDNELWWVRPDGSKTCLTGKSVDAKTFYDRIK